MRYLILATVFILLSTTAMADTLRGGFPICVSEASLSQMYAAIEREDMAGMDYLFDHGCVMTTPGVRASLLDRSNMGAQAHIRVYSSAGAAEAWTSIGALESYQP